MKNLKFLAFCMFYAIIIICTIRCNRDDKKEKVSITSKIVNKSAGGCACLTSPPPNCDKCVSEDLMKGKAEATFTVSWDNCSPDQTCDGTSAVKFCYANPLDCSILRMQIDYPPSCLPCVPNPFCIEGKVTCGGEKGNSFTYTYRDPNTGYNYSLTLTGDPKLKLCCTGDDGIQYCCEGNAVFNN